MTWAAALLAAIAAWNLAPVLMLWALPIPARHKLRGSVSFMRSACSGLLALLPNMLAPVVVPVALLFTPRSANALPRWAAWWDNDVSINGDRMVPAPLEDTPEVRAACYWAPGHHPRSFYARWVWLGLRNRASALAVLLGHTMRPEELADREHWGDTATNRDHEGLLLRRMGGVYQLTMVRRLGALCLRINYGHKLDLVEKHGRASAMVVNISASVLSWKGGVHG